MKRAHVVWLIRRGLKEANRRNFNKNGKLRIFVVARELHYNS
jgi:hypothetical protein